MSAPESEPKSVPEQEPNQTWYANIDVANGPAQLHHTNGQVRCQGDMRERRPHGPWRCYSLMGQMTSLIHYQQGQRHGLAQNWNDQGIQETESQWQSGQMTEVKSFYSAGQLHLQSSYRDGKMHGRWREYYENGQLKAEAEYRNGQLSKPWRYWRPDGQPAADNEIRE